MLFSRIPRHLFLGAVFVLGGLPTLVLSADVAEATKPASLDFSGVRAGEVAQRQIAFSNPGDKPIAIKSVSASCSCTRILGFPKTVAAKSDGTVLLEFRPPKPGHFDIEVLIETDREKDAIMAWHWSGEVAATDTNHPSSAGIPGDAILLSPQDAFAMRGSGSVMLADVREPGDFNLCHVAGSVNWPVRVLKGIASLKARKLVLIGKGSDDESLVREALALRADGFASTQVLQGGLRAWTQRRLPLDGPGVGTVRPASVAPLEFFGTRQDEWLVIEVASPGSILGESIPGASRLPLGAEWVSEFSRILKVEVAKRGIPFRILVVSQAGEPYENIEKALPANLPAPVFYLDGGLRAYRSFAKDQAALQNRREIRLSTNRGLDADFNTTVSRDTTGCESCPKIKAAK